ncbi:LamG domain-containing protein [Modestobacter italicus]|uniref:LamG domain-containing protein n=1 Tax=Modestobacter italicus (strain DSM 44449 / CECT 9708 / BC 501) TaxID=2732864 RepID=UPI001C98659D|nr:LamG domain-containing protein [Modestobacter italicus]
MTETNQRAVLTGLPFGDLIPASSERVADASATGSCLSFPDPNGWADVAVDVSALSSDAATIEVWISSSATPDAGSGQTIYLGQAGDGAAPRLSIDTDSRIHLYWSTTGTGGSHASADTTPVLDGTWHHIAAVIDAGTITFYKDGQPTTEPTPVTMPTGQPATSPCQIGAGFGDAIGYTGQLFDLRLWHTARTGPEIQQLQYAAVDGTLTTQLAALTQQGLILATTFDPTSNAPINLVDGGAGDLHDCTILTSPLPQDRPTITFGSFASDVYGSWNVMTDATTTRMQAAAGDSTAWAGLVQDQMLANGFFTSLQTSGEDGWGDATDTSGRPVKVAEWTDSAGIVHQIQCRAALTPQVGGDPGDPVPTGGGATAQIISSTRGDSALVVQKIEKATTWSGIGTTLAFLVEKAVVKGLTAKLDGLKSTASDAKDLYTKELMSDEGYEQAVADVVEVEGVIKAVEIFGRVTAVLAVLSALVDGIFALFHPTTMSVSMWNETDLDLEWSLGYLNDGSYWVNSDGGQNGDWRPFPKKSTVNGDVSPIFGPITQETVAAVNLLFANGKGDGPLADQPIDQCILVRQAGSTDVPQCLLLSAPLVGANSLGLSAGAGDQAYFNATLAGTPSDQLDQQYTVSIGGEQIDFHLVADALKGQTTYAGFQGYNYNTLLYIKTAAPTGTAR